MGRESPPRPAPMLLTHCLCKAFGLLKLLPGSGTVQTPLWCIGKHVWEYLSLVKCIPEKVQNTPLKDEGERDSGRKRKNAVWWDPDDSNPSFFPPSSFCYYLHNLPFSFRWHSYVLLIHSTIALKIWCPLEVETLASTLTLHFPARGTGSVNLADWREQLTLRTGARGGGARGPRACPRTLRVWHCAVVFVCVCVCLLY